ncbi:MAG: glycosyltransferase [Planctomycetota bacterium]
MSRPRILRVITRLNVGGPSIQALDLAANPLWETRLISGALKPGEEDMSWRAAGNNLDHGILPDLVQPPSPLKDLRALRALVGEIRRFRPDIIHTHHAKAGWLGRLAGALTGTRAVVHTFHGNVFSGHFGPLMSTAVLQAERTLAPLAHKLIAISELQQRDLCDRWQVTEWEHTEVIPLGFDLSTFPSTLTKVEARRALGLPETGTLLGMVGRLTHVKNHAFFLEALARGPASWSATIVGDGELEQSLREQTRRLGLASRVHFVPTVREVANVYRALDLLCIPSHSEGTPVAMIEAMASLTPVVASAVGGIPDLAGRHGERASLHRPGDIPGFLQAAGAALGQGESRLHAAREHVLKNHSASRLAGSLDALYRELLS